MQDLFNDKDFEDGKIAQKENKMPSLKMKKKEVVLKEEQIEESVITMDYEDDGVERKKFYIIDGFGLIFRSYYAFFMNPLFDKDGKNYSAIYGFFNSLSMVIREYKPDYLVVALDSKGPTFRHDMYDLYKANRDAAPDDLKEQIPVIISLLETMKIPTYAKAGLEADDIIASLSDKAVALDLEAVLFTADKDLLQLVNSRVYALRPPKKGQKEYRMFGIREVEEDFLIKPNQIIDYLTLLGDAADNIPGVPGIGSKTAVKLLNQYGDLDNIYANITKLSKGVRKKLEEGKEKALLSKSLVELFRDPEILNDFNLKQFSLDNLDVEAAFPYFEKQKSNSLIASFKRLMSKESVKQYNKRDITAEVNQALEEEYKEKNSSEQTVDESLLGTSTLHPLTDIKELRELFEKIANGPGIMAFDTETTGIDTMVSDMVGFSFSYEPKEAWYFPLVCGGKRVCEDEPVREVFKEYLESGRIGIIGQNIKYDYKILSRFGVKLTNIVYDTMIAAWLYDSNVGIYNMDDLALRYLNYSTVEFNEVVPKGGQFSDLPLEDAVLYAAEDSDITFRLYKVFDSFLEEKQKKVLSDIEIPLITILAEMEMQGIIVSKEKLLKLSQLYGQRIDEITQEIYKLSGSEFNIKSTKQLQKVLFEDLNLTVGKKTKTGYSTATDVLESIKDESPIVKYILEYRGLTKLKSTYIDSLPLLINKDTKRLHTSFLQIGTATGRLSSKNPNLQNIPIRSDDGRRIRDAFVPKEGCVFISADYAQIELVVLAHMAGDEALQTAFRKGVDVHSFTAALVFDKDIEDVSHDERRIAKTINFGVMYGMSAFRLSKELEISRSDANNFIKAYFSRYNGVAKFIDDTVSDVRKKGSIETLFGHRRGVPKINSRNKLEKNASERVAVNSIIQGTAAEIMKIGMIKVAKALKKENLKANLLLQVHDEVILEVPTDEVDKVKAILKESLEGAVKLSIPLRCSIEVGNSWGEMH
jgi:DNA polymerase-1